MQTYVHTNTRAWIFIPAVFTVANKFKKIQMSINRRMGNQNVAHAWDGRLFANRKGKALAPPATRRTWHASCCPWEPGPSRVHKLGSHPPKAHRNGQPLTEVERSCPMGWGGVQVRSDGRRAGENVLDGSRRRLCQQPYNPEIQCLLGYAINYTSGEILMA